MNGMIKRFIFISYGLESTILIPVLINIILFSCMFQTYSDTANAQRRRVFTPRISVYSEYDDNIDLDPNEVSDWITMISPGLSLNLDSLKTKMGLDFETRHAFYKRDSDKDTILHNGTVFWEQALTRNLKFDVRDSFSRSDDPILVSEEGRIEEVAERRIYYRNNGQIGLSWRFSFDGSIGLGYRNSYLHYPDSKSADYEDRHGHEFFFNLNTSFIPSFGIGLESRINRGRFIQPTGFTGEFSEDFIDHEGAITLTYRWHTSRSLFARYSFLDKNFNGPEQALNNMDFRVHQGSLGLSFGLSPHLNFSAEGGYFLQAPHSHYGRKADDDLEREGGSFNVVLNTQMRKATISLGGSGGYAQDYFSSENLGSSRFQQVFGSANYSLSENLSASVSANYRWNEFFDEDNQGGRKDEIWQASIGFNFSFSDWLSLYIGGTHSERKSPTDPEEEFTDNRLMLRLTGAYPILF
jgi:hypothetical protein